jgi:hypothetical protein
VAQRETETEWIFCICNYEALLGRGVSSPYVVTYELRGPQERVRYYEHIANQVGYICKVY